MRNCHCIIFENIYIIKNRLTFNKLKNFVNNSIDIITAGQAFHWFNLEKTKLEFQRILKPNGWVILIWNRRRKHTNEFLKEYEFEYVKLPFKEIKKSQLEKFLEVNYKKWKKEYNQLSGSN